MTNRRLRHSLRFIEATFCLLLRDGSRHSSLLDILFFFLSQHFGLANEWLNVGSK